MFEDELTDWELQELYKAHTAQAWKQGNLSYKMHDAQLLIYEQLRRVPKSKRLRLLECARSFGKSGLGVIMALEDCLRPPFTYPVRIIGPELKQTVEIVTPLLQLFAEDAPPGFVTPLKSESKWLISSGPGRQNQLIIGGFNRDYIDKLRGQRAKSIYLEEPRDVSADHLKYGLKDVLMPMSYQCFAPITMLTTSPKELDHYIITDIAPQAELDEAYFNFTIYDNPLATPEMIDLAIKESGGADSETFLREYMCKRIKSATDLVVPEFDEEEHVYEFMFPDYTTWQTVIDFGGVRDKTVAGVSFFHYGIGKRVLADERVFPANTPTDVIIRTIHEMEAPYLEYGKPQRWADAPGQLLVDLGDQGFHCALPRKDNWEAAISNLKVAIKTDKWAIHPRCAFTINTLKHARFNPNKTDFIRSDTLGHCDAIAMMMYAERMLDSHTNPFPKPVYNRDTTQVVPLYAPRDPLVDLSNSITPRTFGNTRKNFMR